MKPAEARREVSHEINSLKHDLLALVRKLEETRNRTSAKQLAVIIGRLEAFQSRLIR